MKRKIVLTMLIATLLLACAAPTVDTQNYNEDLLPLVCSINGEDRRYFGGHYAIDIDQEDRLGKVDFTVYWDIDNVEAVTFEVYDIDAGPWARRWRVWKNGELVWDSDDHDQTVFYDCGIGLQREGPESQSITIKVRLDVEYLKTTGATYIEIYNEQSMTFSFSKVSLLESFLIGPIVFVIGVIVFVGIGWNYSRKSKKGKSKAVEQTAVEKIVLVICSYCGAKTEQGITKCQKCGAEL